MGTRCSTAETSTPQTNWYTMWDKPGWITCPDTQVLFGLERSGCSALSCLNSGSYHTHTAHCSSDCLHCTGTMLTCLYGQENVPRPVKVTATGPLSSKCVTAIMTWTRIQSLIKKAGPSATPTTTLRACTGRVTRCIASICSSVATLS